METLNRWSILSLYITNTVDTPADFLGIGSKPEYYLSLAFFRRVTWQLLELGGWNKTGSQRLILSNDLINMPSVRPPNPSPAPVRFLYPQAQWADGFRTDGRRAPEETNMVPALSLLCGLCPVLGQKAGNVFQMEIGTVQSFRGDVLICAVRLVWMD